ncbi:unnamed protein product [Rhizoctonia solani]|uniref:Uncharacterized protein n=1 Tax=Rhizoctonia solani TaxID=456999 RepID=A0A8H3A562_9AGAM|nr:uncharacterized protein RhiXN_11408 [Rhizoctonia solani]QRW24496.1 hypothetical protein RhiXN_11408 [Rhizoctonia solani]CAE6408867.1 unnamed protein product [Rhizoctonia solani]
MGRSNALTAQAPMLKPSGRCVDRWLAYWAMSNRPHPAGSASPETTPANGASQSAEAGRQLNTPLLGTLRGMAGLHQGVVATD